MDGFQLPPRKKLSDFVNQESFTTHSKGRSIFVRSEQRTPRKGSCWSEEEHLAFLAGLKRLGKGNWTGISRYYVPTRTSTQIASHAQKYLQRLAGATKRKSKFSDIEEQVQASRLADDFKPKWPLPEKLDQAPLHCAEPAPKSPVAPQLGARASWAGPCSRPKKIQRVCKPTAVKASSSEPDLLKLAEGLLSLSESRRTFNTADTSAFKRANSAQPQC